MSMPARKGRPKKFTGMAPPLESPAVEEESRRATYAEQMKKESPGAAG